MSWLEPIYRFLRLLSQENAMSDHHSAISNQQSSISNRTSFAAPYTLFALFLLISLACSIPGLVKPSTPVASEVVAPTFTPAPPPPTPQPLPPAIVESDPPLGGKRSAHATRAIGQAHLAR